MFGMGVADAAVDPVSGDDQIGIGKGFCAVDLGLVTDIDAKFRGPCLQDIQKLHPADAAETMPAGPLYLTPEMGLHIVPVIKVLTNGCCADRVGVAKIAKGLV